MGSADLLPIIFLAGLTFSLQRIGKVSVLAACIPFVSIFALTNRESKMNICIVSTYSCTFDEFQQVVNASMDEASKFLTDWELVKVNDHKSIMLCNVHDMEGMEAFMSTPEMQEWDKANNCVDTIYSMERVN